MPIAKLILYKALVNSDIGNNSLSDKSPNESDTKALAFIENIREIKEIIFFMAHFFLIN